MADAFLAHDEALRYGGRPGVSSLHLIQSALGRPYSGYHPKIAAKAAATLHSCVSNHGFVDGNKRTAWILTELLIERSGYSLNIPDDEPIDDLVVAVAAGEVDFSDLEDWFQARLVRSRY
ncbi:type II toxin-antitoxin system death-on-curing family toxin [uncultured Tateyamaria sp.]|uniref:type II toxin-antitoxin system death-on-curing family toxin n=1 Tax=uncultured Tateyamaria sp. TaxID=455651 RepID=UPI002634043A|nr:type II toxin-antitoxin system death-on-curing family toxin [uncultured Tateyamaria sp.]